MASPRRSPPARKPAAPRRARGPRARTPAVPAEPEAALPVDGPELRQRILDASVALIEQQGLANFSMREVARRAGVSHQAPYHHFADREAILAAVCEDGFRELSRRMGEAGRDVPPIERLQRAAVAYVGFALAHPAHFRLMFRPEMVSQDHYPRVECEAERSYTLLTEMVGDYVTTGRGWQGHEMGFVTLCWSMVHGLASLLIDGPLELKTKDLGATRDQLLAGVLQAFDTVARAVHKRGPGSA